MFERLQSDDVIALSALLTLGETWSNVQVYILRHLQSFFFHYKCNVLLQCLITAWIPVSGPSRLGDACPHCFCPSSVVWVSKTECEVISSTTYTRDTPHVQHRAWLSVRGRAPVSTPPGWRMSTAASVRRRRDSASTTECLCCKRTYCSACSLSPLLRSSGRSKPAFIYHEVPLSNIDPPAFVYRLIYRVADARCLLEPSKQRL